MDVVDGADSPSDRLAEEEGNVNVEVGRAGSAGLTERRSAAFTRALHFSARCLSERTSVSFESALAKLESALRSTSSPLERYIILTAAERFGDETSILSREDHERRKAEGGGEDDDALYSDTTQKPCSKCGQCRAYVSTGQTRRGDEGTTIFVACICRQNRWKYS